MDRCALFVDAGYVLGDGALAVHGTRNRDSVSWDYAGVLQVLKNVARDHTGLPLLRCYWYEATVEGRRSTEHETLADLPGVKLRLGRMKPGRREGVESEIHRDLTTLARNRAISDALVVSAEEDLAQVIADVQDLGLRVILVHIAAPGCTAAAALRQECDDIVEISEAHLRPSVELVVGAEPVTEEERPVAAVYASPAPANGHGPHGLIGQPALPAAGHAAPPPIYTGSVIAEYQRAAQPGNNHRPALADASGPARAGNHSLTGAPGAQPGAAPGTPAGPRDLTGQTALPPAPPPPAPPAPAPPPAVSQPAAAAQPAVSQPGSPVPQAGLAGLPGVPGHHAATSGHHAAPGHHAATPGQHVPPGAPLMQPGQPGPAHVSGPLTAPLPTASPHAQLPRAGGQHAGLPSAPSDSGPAVQGQHAQHGLPPQPLPPQALPARQPVPGAAMPGAAMPGQPVPGPSPVPAAPVAAHGFQPPAGQPVPQGPRQGVPAYQAAPPPPAPAPPVALAPPALVPPAAPPGFPAQAPDVAGGQAPASPRPPTVGAPPGPVAPAPPAGAGVPALAAARPGAQLRGVPGGYPVAPPAQPVDQRARPYPVAPGQPDGEPYIPQQGPHSGPQPVAQHALVPQPVAVSLADAVQAAHGEGFNFGQGVARDAPALWLEAVLARKPRMPSDLEARLLQDSSLPIDSLLHDEVRHALRRGFWDALERVRH